MADEFLNADSSALTPCILPCAHRRRGCQGVRREHHVPSDPDQGSASGGLNKRGLTQAAACPLLKRPFGLTAGGQLCRRQHTFLARADLHPPLFQTKAGTSTSTTIVGTIRGVVEREGPKGLYRGIQAQIVSAFVVGAILLTVRMGCVFLTDGRSCCCCRCVLTLQQIMGGYRGQPLLSSPSVAAGVSSCADLRRPCFNGAQVKEKTFGASYVTVRWLQSQRLAASGKRLTAA